MYFLKFSGILQISIYFISFCAGVKVQNFQETHGTNTDQSYAMDSLLAAIQNESYYSTLVLWRHQPADCFAELSDWGSENLTTKLIFDSNYTKYLNGYLNRAVLNVVCLDDFVDLFMLENLAESLQHMRETRLLFLLKNFTTQPVYELEELFNFCHAQQMLNVLAVGRDFATTGDFYTFQRFPNFTVECNQWPGTFYPNRLRDLQGYEFITMHSQSEPGSIVYTDRLGNKCSSGYVYKLISNFVQKLNGSLTYRAPVNVGASIEISVLADLTSSYEVDIPIGLQMPVENMSLYAFSNIVEISNWMPMLPRAGYIERYLIYKYIFQSNTLIIDVLVFVILSLLYTCIVNGQKRRRRSATCLITWKDIVFNDKIFRGVIGLSFQLWRERNYKFYLLYLLIFLQGLIWSTIYSAQLHAYSSRPPSGEQIKSYDDLRASNVKIAIPLEEYELLENVMPVEFMQKYRDIFLVMPDLRDFYTLRTSLDTHFAYSTHTEIWAMVERQQRYFTQRLFRVSDEVQFHRQILLAVPLAENSVYRATFNAYLLDMQAYGFWAHWTAISLYEMVKAGKLTFEDLSKTRGNEALKFVDLYYIWWIYIFGIAMGTLCFIAEVVRERFTLGEAQHHLLLIWRELREQFV